jgi:hypothetical protein
MELSAKSVGPSFFGGSGLIQRHRTCDVDHWDFGFSFFGCDSSIGGRITPTACKSGRSRVDSSVPANHGSPVGCVRVPRRPPLVVMSPFNTSSPADRDSCCTLCILRCLALLDSSHKQLRRLDLLLHNARALEDIWNFSRDLLYIQQRHSTLQPRQWFKAEWLRGIRDEPGQGVWPPKCGCMNLCRPRREHPRWAEEVCSLPATFSWEFLQRSVSPGLPSLVVASNYALSRQCCFKYNPNYKNKHGSLAYRSGWANIPHGPWW